MLKESSYPKIVPSLRSLPSIFALSSITLNQKLVSFCFLDYLFDCFLFLRCFSSKVHLCFQVNRRRLTREINILSSVVCLCFTSTFSELWTRSFTNHCSMSVKRWVIVFCPPPASRSSSSLFCPKVLPVAMMNFFVFL